MVRRRRMDLVRCLTPSFYGPGFHRSVLRAVFHLVLAIVLAECWRVRTFYHAHAEEFDQLHGKGMLQSTLDSVPEDLALDIWRANPDAGQFHPELTVNRETPFRLPLPPWCSSALTLLISFLARSDEPDALLLEALPSPVILFAKQRELARMGGAEDLVHLTVRSARSPAPWQRLQPSPLLAAA